MLHLVLNLVHPDGVLVPHTLFTYRPTHTTVVYLHTNLVATWLHEILQYEAGMVVFYV